MNGLERFERRFQMGGELLPWQESHKPFDFNQSFVDWIHQRYLPVALGKEVREIERWQAVQWLNKAKFDQERLEVCFLQWMEFELRLRSACTDEVTEVETPVEDPSSPEAVEARERARELLRQRGLER